MNFKKHWEKQNGLTKIYEKETAGCKKLEISGLKLSKGEKYDFTADEREFAVTILGGTCNVTGGVEYKGIGKRKNVFDGKAYAFYVPKNTAFTVECVSDDFEAIIAACPSENEHKSVLITPDDVVVKFLGKPGFEREAHFLIDERMEADRVYVGENFINGGQWSSYPGHKHDVNNMPAEGFAEEIYYYEYDKETGFGIQRVYNDDKTVDENYATYNGDFVEMPFGYHPCTVAPGYKGYLLWMMSCDNRGFYMSVDPDHAWLNK